MFAGDTFTVDQRRSIDRAVRQAEADSGLAFHIRVGGVEGDPRGLARQLLQQMPEPGRSVVVLVAPGDRALEIVTGSVAAQRLTDAECALAAVGMESSFLAGDLPGGVVAGIQQLGEHARRPEALHTQPPPS